MGRPLVARLLDQSDIAIRMVDPDQHLDAAAQILPKDRFQRIRDRLAHDRRHDDRYVARALGVKTVIRKRCETRREPSGHNHRHCLWSAPISRAGMLAWAKSDSGAADLQPTSFPGYTRVASAASGAIPRSLDPHVECFLSSRRTRRGAALRRGRTPRKSYTSGKAVEDHARVDGVGIWIFDADHLRQRDVE
jgi:hypothetical protein